MPASDSDPNALVPAGDDASHGYTSERKGELLAALDNHPDQSLKLRVLHEATNLKLNSNGVAALIETTLSQANLAAAQAPTIIEQQPEQHPFANLVTGLQLPQFTVADITANEAQTPAAAPQVAGLQSNKENGIG